MTKKTHTSLRHFKHTLVKKEYFKKEKLKVQMPHRSSADAGTANSSTFFFFFIFFQNKEEKAQGSSLKRHPIFFFRIKLPWIFLF